MIDQATLLSEIADLERKLAALRAMLDAFYGSAPKPSPRTEPQRPFLRLYPSGRKTTRVSRNAPILEAAEALVYSYDGEPIPTVVMLRKLATLGHDVPGENPQNNLSAMLSNSGRFISNGRAGWTLKDAPRAKVSAPAGGLELQPDPPADALPAGRPAHLPHAVGQGSGPGGGT